MLEIKRYVGEVAKMEQIGELGGQLDTLQEDGWRGDGPREWECRAQKIKIGEQSAENPGKGVEFSTISSNLRNLA